MNDVMRTRFIELLFHHSEIGSSFFMLTGSNLLAQLADGTPQGSFDCTIVQPTFLALTKSLLCALGIRHGWFDKR